MTDKDRTEEDERIAGAMMACSSIKDMENLTTFHTRPKIDSAYEYLKMMPHDEGTAEEQNQIMRKKHAWFYFFKLLDLEADREPVEA